MYLVVQTCSSFLHSRPTRLLEQGRGSYRGEWLQGAEHGHGLLTQSDGSTIEGEWHEGQPIGKHAVVSKTGQTSEIDGEAMFA